MAKFEAFEFGELVLYQGLEVKITGITLEDDGYLHYKVVGEWVIAEDLTKLDADQRVPPLQERLRGRPRCRTTIDD